MSYRARLITTVVSLTTLLAAGCQIWRMMPRGPVVDESTRRAVWGEHEPSGVDYTGRARVDHPLVPFLVFGLTYDLDIVLVSDHPDWEMHEYARLQTPEGPVWLAKDTRATNGNQLLVGDAEALTERLPEVPLLRKPTGLTVRNRSTDRLLDLRFAYENADGAPVHVRYRGPRPRHRLARDNGSTMGHSRHQVMAVLDLPRRQFGRSASISIGGKPRGIVRMLGLQPMRLALTQTQAGIPEADVELAELASRGSFRSTHHLPGGVTMSRDWKTREVPGGLVVYQHSDWRRLAYRFVRRDNGALELTDARVYAWNSDRPIFRIAFSPALPDLRRRFEGTHRSRLVMDVGHGRNHAVGSATVTSGPDGAEVAIRAAKPWWVAERCVDSSIAFRSDGPTRLRTKVAPCP